MNQLHSVSAPALLRRETEPVYGPEARLLIEGKRVLVTGAGGSIGSEIVRQLHGLGAAEIFYVDTDEYALYTLQRKLSGHALLDDEHFVLANVQNQAKINQIFAQVRPEIVYHAAAHKHLPLLERSPEAAILTNTWGTQVVADAAARFGVKRLVNISTDKAANPTSILGMTKRLAEVVVASRARGGLRAASVRFGNVLGSRGSFMETLQHQIGEGLPVTVTHRDVTRFFMTIPEAAALVIEASVLSDRGETYVLDMGKPVGILDLVQNYARLAGAPIPTIIFTGLRPGEKMHEELFDSSEAYEPTPHQRITKAQVGASTISGDDLHKLYLLTEAATPADLHDHLTRMLTGGELTFALEK